MEKTTSLHILWGLVAVLSLVLGALVFSTTVQVDKPYPVTEIKTVNVPTADPNTTAKIDQILASQTKEDNFKTFSLNLAKDELDDNAYRALFNFLVSESISIDDKKDITEVEIRESHVTNIDVDEGNSDVELELRVRYEDSDGDRKRATVFYNVEIIDNEVDSDSYSL